MSSIFETALKNTLNSEVSYTENGAIGFKTSGKALLDLNFSVSSLRKANKETIEKKFSDAFFESPMYAIKWLFFARDVRGGMGERRIFRICFEWLANTRPEVVKKLIPLVAEFGRFDDLLYSGLEGELWDVVVDYIDNQITEDYKNASAGKPTSLLAKWLPSCNTSSSETRNLAKKIYTALKLSEKEYRKMLSKIRANLKVVEVDASAKNWSAIDYEKVPSMANLKYKNAFLRNDETRRREYLAKLDKGEAKINSSVAFPCDIVHNYVSKNTSYGYCKYNYIQIDSALEAMWKSLPDYAINGNVLCVCDSSGSMTTPVSGSMTALDVCYALGIYCAEHCTGPFKDKYITFSSRPQYIDMSNAKSLVDKLKISYSHSEVANTNLEAVFDLVLQTAVDHKLKQEDIPTLVILSDMEIDQGADFGTRSYSQNYNARKTALMEQIKKRYEAAGYNLPRTVWWNIASRSGTIPLQQNSETGIILCSGYSQNTFKMLASNKTDPYEVLLETLDVERYKVIEETVKDLI